MGYNKRPVIDIEVTLQMLSTNIMSVQLNPQTLNIKEIKQIGTQVPGPLHKIKSGLADHTNGIQCKVAYNVVKIVLDHD